MGIQELTDKAKKTAKERTPANRAELLKKAHIIDDNGYFSEQYFSQDTVNKDKQTHPVAAV